MKHIAIFNNSGDVQTALNEETLLNPYVALVSGALDYNSLQPVQPCYLGEWSTGTSFGKTVYTFQILDDDMGKWMHERTISIIPNAYFDGHLTNVNIILAAPASNWVMSISTADGSEPEQHEFYAAGEWVTQHTVLVPDKSYGGIKVNLGGNNTFTFRADGT